jgi:SAM-dependent methyltransferase
MEPTAENRRAWDELHRLRVAGQADEPGIPAAIRALLPELQDRRVLHLMCGTGEASAELAELGALVTAIDVWPDALSSARERFRDVLFVHADPHELPLQVRRRRCDLVYAGRGFLPSVHDLELVLDGVARVLKARGLLLLWDEHPALECLDLTSLRWREDYFSGAREVPSRLGPPRHVPMRRLGEIVNAVVRSGLAVRRLEEFPTLSRVRRHDPRVPGEFALLAEKPSEAGASRRAASASRRPPNARPKRRSTR